MAEKNIATRAAAGFLAVAMIFHSPAMHDLVTTSVLQLRFAEEWAEAKAFLGRDMPWSEFKDGAELWVYHPDPDIHIQWISLLKRPSLCFPTSGGEGDPYGPPTVVFACHATGLTEDPVRKMRRAMKKERRLKKMQALLQRGL